MNLDRLHCRKRASATSQPPSTVNERVTGLQQTTDELNSHLTMTSRHVANNNDGGGEEEDDDDDDVSTKEYNATDNDATDATDAATKSTTWNRSNFVNEFDIRTSTTTHRQTNKHTAKQLRWRPVGKGDEGYHSRRRRRLTVRSFARSLATASSKQ